jgi:glutathione S-transferase
MKLYFSPGSSSLSTHIALREAGIAVELEQVDTQSKMLKRGGDFRTINPKGAVPTLELDDGQILTEGPAIVQYIADLRPDLNLAPPPGSLERVRLQEWISFISMELHRTISPMFSPTATSEFRQTQAERLEPKLDFLNSALSGKPFLMGDQFTVADGYLFAILSWTIPLKIDLTKWPVVKNYRGRIASRPAVRSTLKEEGLIP